ncbi:MAG: XTP/dITP diphosphatase [Nitrospirae bacterium]|nr:XTP/dITP diphosphatase [Nitrospirota bacterium]
MKITLATRNKKKVEEFKRMLSGMDISILALDDYPDCPEVEEDMDTFEGNAVKKARSVAACTHTMAVADDSGLEVYALNGRPGVMSARYAGEKAGDIDNVNKLLLEMKDVPDSERGARFVCCIAAAFQDGRIETFTDVVEGVIGRECKGRNGFGYDPLFYPEGSNKTFAEISPEEKDSMSHRGKALKKFKEFMLKHQQSAMHN